MTAIVIRENTLMFGDKESTHEPNVMSIEVNDNTVRFTELCDGYFATDCSKSDAIDALETMIKFIEEH